MVDTIDAVEAGLTRRPLSLRREWSRAFALMLALLLVAAIASIAGMLAVVSGARHAASVLRRETAVVSQLRSEVVTHEELGHTILSGGSVNQDTFDEQQQQLQTAFASALAVFPTGDGSQAIVARASSSWEQGLRSYGLWSSQLTAQLQHRSQDNPAYGQATDDTVALIDDLVRPSLLAIDSNLRRSGELEYALTATLATLFGAALLMMGRFRFRLNRDLMGPMASLREGVTRLRGGDYDQRVVLGRADELGQLAEAFNEMSAALQSHHITLQRQATYDSLTGLANRETLLQKLSSLFSTDAKGSRPAVTVLFIDVDDFKLVNDRYGHAGGDELLKEIADRLRASVRVDDLVARLGGDEFAILLDAEHDARAAEEISQRILAACSEPFPVHDRMIGVSLSIGVASRNAATERPSDLLRHADFAMYVAKDRGKGRYALFDTLEVTSAAAPNAVLPASTKRTTR